MGMVQIDDVREGMILEEDVLQNGQALMKAGMKLNDRHLRLCKQWGVESLNIHGTDAEKVEKDFLSQVPPEVFRSAEEQATANCKNWDLTQPLLQDFYQLHLHRLIEKAMYDKFGN